MKSKDDLKKKLTSEQYTVTQEGGTEAPFKNEYWDNKRPGIYVDLTSGEALFSSLDKFDSGTGWPSFSKGINDSKLETKTDLKFGMERTEVKSKSSNNHLGHVFNDGPKDAGGKRFCINSAALKFIPLEAMEKEGYSKYLPLFDGAASVNQSTKQTAVLAGGCFWGMEDLIRKLPGVVNTDVGYIGGETKDPTYEVVKTGKSGHAEALRVEFDPSKITYAQLLEYYFRIHDPTTLNQQGNDVGSQYRSAIFVLNEEQRKIAEEIKMANARKWPKPIVTQIVPYTEFKLAEGYHQDYLKKNPQGYTCHWVRP